MPEAGTATPAAIEGDLGRLRYEVGQFRPAWWLPGAHLQTLGARALRSRRGIRYRRERLELSDGDFLDLDFAGPEDTGVDHTTERASPLVLILHGLEGGATSGYVVETCRALLGRGIRAVAMNFRSRSGEPNRRAESYHAGKTDDLDRVLERLARIEPRVPLGAIGFSLGGNVLLKHLGESGDGSPLSAAAVVSVPFDLASSAACMERGLARIYSGYFLRSLRGSLRRKAERLPDALPLAPGLAARTIREFDDAVTAPVHGFRDAEHYYRSSSSRDRLDGIHVPTLVLHALDDPLVPSETVPIERIRGQPRLVDGIVSRGGQVGFVSGETPGRARFWAEDEVARFLDTVLRDAPGARTRTAERRP